METLIVIIKAIRKALGIKKKRTPKNRINNVWLYKANKNKKDKTYYLEARYDNVVVKRDKLEYVDFIGGDGVKIKFQKEGVTLVK